MFRVHFAGGLDFDTAEETDAIADDSLWSAASKAIGYRKTIDARPQRPEVGYRQMVETLHRPLPLQGTAAADVIDELAVDAEPGLNAMAGPRFFGWVTGGSHPVGVAADWLTSAWGRQNCGNHHGAPAAAAFEEIAATWVLDLLDLPRESSVGFVTGATSANFVGLAAARHALLAKQGWNVETQGLFGAPAINVLVGDDAHATVFKALGFLGLGSERVVRLATDDAGRILVEPFLEALDQAVGPTIVIAQAGQINTGAFDPFSEISEACACREDSWLHVDGAFGLWARASSEQAGLADGTCFAGGAEWRGRWIMRLSCISSATTNEDADRSVDAIIDAWRSIRRRAEERSEIRRVAPRQIGYGGRRSLHNARVVDVARN